MQQYGMVFGFREPYQILGNPLELPKSDIQLLKRSQIVDADMIQDTERFKMDLVGGACRESSYAV